MSFKELDSKRMKNLRRNQSFFNSSQNYGLRSLVLESDCVLQIMHSKFAVRIDKEKGLMSNSLNTMKRHSTKQKVD